MKAVESIDDIANDALRGFYERWQHLPREGGALPHSSQVTGAFLGDICGYCKVSKPLSDSFDVEYLYLGDAVDLFVTCVFPLGVEIETSDAWEDAVANTPWLNG